MLIVYFFISSETFSCFQQQNYQAKRKLNKYRTDVKNVQPIRRKKALHSSIIIKTIQQYRLPFIQLSNNLHHLQIYFFVDFSVVCCLCCTSCGIFRIRRIVEAITISPWKSTQQ